MYRDPLEETKKSREPAPKKIQGFIALWMMMFY